MPNRPLRLAVAAIGATMLAPVAGQAQAQAHGRGYAALPRPAPADYGRRYGAAYRPREAAPVQCDRGTGGTILGAIAAGLLGNVAAGPGNREGGTMIGAGVGALAGRAADRDC